jgi:AmiR/NasT family two-component response regulator
MSIQILRDLRGLRVLVVHPPDAEGVDLVGHLRRIGCQVDAAWPIPELADGPDVVVLAVDHESKAAIQRFVRSFNGNTPTMIGVVGYEDPSILQIVLDARAHAVIERPVRPFGLLTQLTIARSLWLERREAARQILKAERKLAGWQNIQRAKAILMAAQALTEEEAHQSIRRKAMSKRVAIEEMALAIINANELLKSAPKSP